MTDDPAPIQLTTHVGEVAGAAAAAGFARLGIRSVADLLRHLPLRYEREFAEQTVAGVAESVEQHAGRGVNVATRGEIETIRPVRRPRPRLEATLADGTGTLRLTWFNAPWMRDRLHPGMRLRVQGPASRYQDSIQMINPRWELIDDEHAVAPRAERLRPVYPANDEVTSATIDEAVAKTLTRALSLLDDHLHEAYRRERALPTLAEAYRMIHRPEDEQEIAAATRRLALDELLMMQLGVMIKRRHRRESQRAIPLRHDDSIDQHITARFPFELTEAQRTAIDEIVGDLVEPVPMNRLLQGDVGAGKTVVALYAALMAIASGHQAALMAPTELLAEQHHASISAMLAGADVTIELLTGSSPPAERERVVAALAAGDADLVIGTHSLLTGDVRFRSLAVVVVDEQHRFGVHQRATLRSKASEPATIPHTLVMTATPIPRTLSLTVFGDLDVSTIHGLPPGRVPVISKHVRPADVEQVYRYLDDRIAAGEQAYIVVPVIDESDSGLTAVTSHLRSLERGPLRRRRLAALHGRLGRDERESIMERFRAREIDALVCTTVIEVGVDVPNACIIVIEQAERFGLAQLHQLRGRVGRSERQALCVLVSDPTTEDGERRIEAIVDSNDGFTIAERDLEIRGPGEVFGSRQSGVAPFRVARIPRDVELLRLARRDATQWIEDNPMLTGERDALLRRRLLKAHGESLGLGDVA